jgi:hypothetical protein
MQIRTTVEGTHVADALGLPVEIDPKATTDDCYLVAVESDDDANAFKELVAEEAE